MKKRILWFSALALLLNSCSLSQMVKMAKEQELTVTPNPLEVHGDSVVFEMSALLPLKMLKKNKIYTMNARYQYGDQSVDLGNLEMKADDYPTAKTEQPKISKRYSFAYKPEIGNGDVIVIGTASNEAKTKSKSTTDFPVAKGLITTSRLVKDFGPVAYAEHGYNNKEELEPTTVSFFFDQGRSNLKSTEIKGNNGKALDAFLTSKNVTRTVTIIGSHSPEGREAKNTGLANDRAMVIEKYYKGRMKHYQYSQGAIDSIQFVMKALVLDWEGLKRQAEASTSLTAEQKTQVMNIVNGGGSFEEKEKQLQGLPFYKKELLGKIYPKLRTAKTEILTVKKKKTDAEIGLLARQMAEGKVKYDTLSMEELLYAGTLTGILSEREAIYKAAIAKKDNWVAHNNLGAVYLEMAKLEMDASKRSSLVDNANTQLSLAKAQQNAPEVVLNMASAAAMKGMRADARRLAMEAAGMQSAPDAVRKGAYGILGVCDIKDAKYDNAISNLSKATEDPIVVYNLALANLLKKDFTSAKSGFDKYKNVQPNDAWGFYLAAVTASRQADEGTLSSNLKTAVQKDRNLAAKATADMEFFNYWNAQTFQDAIK